MDIRQDSTLIERQLFDYAASHNQAIYGNLELSPLCNMDCDMCFVRLSRSEMEKQGRLRTVEEWKALTNQLVKTGVLFIQLTGGEPLLYPGFKELYMHLRRQGMVVTVNTNGTLLDEEWADFFAQMPPRRINITLYGADDGAYEELCHHKGGFQKVLRAVTFLKARNVDVKLNGSLVKRNGGEWQRLVEIAQQLQVPIKIDTYMFPATRERQKPYNLQSRLEPEEAGGADIEIKRAVMGEKEFKGYSYSFLHDLSKTEERDPQPLPMTCLAGKCSFIVNWQGELRPCIIMPTPSVPVFEMGFQKGWEKIVEETAQIRFSPKCGGCKLRSVCTVCAANTLMETGNQEEAPDYVCRFTKQQIKCLSSSASSRTHR